MSPVAASPQRRVAAGGVARAHRVHEGVHHAVHREELARRRGRAVAVAGMHPLAELQDQASCSARSRKSSQRQRPHHRVLIAQREARLALVRRDEVEAA